MENSKHYYYISSNVYDFMSIHYHVDINLEFPVLDDKVVPPLRIYL